MKTPERGGDVIRAIHPGVTCADDVAGAGDCSEDVGEVARSAGGIADIAREFEVSGDDICGEVSAPCADVSARRVCSLRRSASVALRVEGAVKR